MKLLIIVGYDLEQNSSANLCHLAYIKGFVQNNCDITLITAKSNLVQHDKLMKIDENVNVKYYSSDTIWTRMNKILKRKNVNSIYTQNNNLNTSKKIELKKIIKNLIIDKIYMMDNKWIKRASKFKSDVFYDYVISLAYPPASHKVAINLLNKKRIFCNKYIQIWEDPWIEDLFFSQDRNLVKIEEENLLDSADIVYYVSPLTLANQKKIFAKQSHKMKWIPLPTYYEKNNIISTNKYIFGYFGDYVPYVRDLSNFYHVMKETQYTTYICGNPYGLFKENSTIQIFPRKPLKELEELENKTSVLVFLCNLKGGQIPGKLYQYAATNKIILFILDGTPEEKQVLFNYFSQFNRFVFCENNKKDIKRAILEIVSSKYDETAFKLDYFSPKNITKKILHEEDEL